MQRMSRATNDTQQRRDSPESGSLLPQMHPSLAVPDTSVSFPPRAAPRSPRQALLWISPKRRRCYPCPCPSWAASPTSVPSVTTYLLHTPPSPAAAQQLTLIPTGGPKRTNPNSHPPPNLSSSMSLFGCLSQTLGSHPDLFPSPPQTQSLPNPVIFCLPNAFESGHLSPYPLPLPITAFTTRLLHVTAPGPGTAFNQSPFPMKTPFQCQLLACLLETRSPPG